MTQALKRLYDIDTVLVVRSYNAMPADLTSYGLEQLRFLEVVVTEPYLALRSVEELPPPGELAERAVSLEKRHGVSFLEIIRTDRHLGMGFVPNISFPRSAYGKDATYAQTIDLICRLLDLYVGLLDKYEPIALFGLPIGIDTAPLADLAAHRGIPLRYPVKARWSQDNFHWACDRFGTWLGIEEQYKQALSAEASPDVSAAKQSKSDAADTKLDMPYRMKVAMRAASKQTGILYLAKRLATMIAREGRKRLRGRREVYGQYLLRENLLLAFQQWRFGRRIIREKPVMDTLDPSTPFVFFPLQTEPESNLMCEIPEFDNQLTAIDLLAKTMPAGWYLVIKEHPAQTGSRLRRFWDVVRRYPNVVVAATLEGGEELLERCQALAMINASLGYQAAASGKPVLSFHKHFNANHVPHMFYVTSYADVRNALSKISGGNIHPIEQRQRAGRAFVAAMQANSFRVDDPYMREGVCGPQPIAKNVAEAVAECLIESLEMNPAGRPAIGKVESRTDA